jgi:hypothetical protein
MLVAVGVRDDVVPLVSGTGRLRHPQDRPAPTRNPARTSAPAASLPGPARTTCCGSCRSSTPAASSPSHPRRPPDTPGQLTAPPSRRRPAPTGKTQPAAQPAAGCCRAPQKAPNYVSAICPRWGRCAGAKFTSLATPAPPYLISGQPKLILNAEEQQGSHAVPTRRQHQQQPSRAVALGRL